MTDEIFILIDKAGFANWEVVLLGLQGVPGCNSILSSEVVQNFAEKQLLQVEPSNKNFVDIYTLATENLTAVESIEVIKASGMGTDMYKARKIWRAFSLMQVINNIPTNPLYGMIRLGEFWNAWEWPQDAAICMQTNDVIATSSSIPSREEFIQILESNKKWLAKEIKLLRRYLRD